MIDSMGLFNKLIPMPLPLDDPLWEKLSTSYGDTEDLVSWLEGIYESGGIPEGMLGDIINEVQHQGGTSSAMYAVATHLIALAEAQAPETALELLSHAGLIHAQAGRPTAVPCPEFLQAEFSASRDQGARQLAPLLPLTTGFDAFNLAIAGLAGFLGHQAYARLLTGFDFFEGKFYHPATDGAFPADD